jgi:hypothetical protein
MNFIQYIQVTAILVATTLMIISNPRIRAKSCQLSQTIVIPVDSTILITASNDN